ncbi:MAG: MarR family transcriptional regulator [Marivita sp.]|uniref:MarR family winged helix-turn-helix transcriptional regulator n=1 Tax=Marivita sp. TaxID=2003365 RepID=UPI0025BDDB8F|nr:MarR family transcriptional regulator [Marivita sp.]MCI5109463.1 MarR family transcriptional regulator [Marivita sp.]
MDREPGAAPRSRDDLPEQYRDERVAHLIRLCARGFNRSLTRRLADSDVSFGQWVFLRILWKEEGLTQRQLSERANLTEPTVHTALTKMAAQGMIIRRTEDGNRRKQHVYLTNHGRSLKSVLEPLAVDANETALQGLDPETSEQLRTLLIHILGNLERDEAEAEARGLRIPPTRGGNV